MRLLVAAATLGVVSGKLIICMGDSLTAGFGSTDPSRDSYPNVLQRLLPDHTVEAYAVGGTTGIANTDRPFVGTWQHAFAMITKPDVVFLMLGTNDSEEDRWNVASYERDMGRLVRSLEALDGSPKVILLAPPPLYPVPSRTGGHQPNVVTYAVPRALEGIAARQLNATFSDRVFERLGGATLGCRRCFFSGGRGFKGGKRGGERFENDGIHPTDFGYEAIAHAACDILREEAIGIRCATGWARHRGGSDGAARRGLPRFALAAAVLVLAG